MLIHHYIAVSIVVDIKLSDHVEAAVIILAADTEIYEVGGRKYYYVTSAHGG